LPCCALSSALNASGRCDVIRTPSGYPCGLVGAVAASLVTAGQPQETRSASVGVVGCGRADSWTKPVDGRAAAHERKKPAWREPCRLGRTTPGDQPGWPGCPGLKPDTEAEREILKATLPLDASDAATGYTSGVQQRFARDSLSRLCNRRLHYHTSMDWRNLFLIDVLARTTQSSISDSIRRPASPLGSLRRPVP